MRAALAVMLGALLCAPCAHGATIYVSAAHGDDAADGSRAHPFSTLHRATAGLRAADRLIVLPGIYAGPLQLSASGAPGRPIEVVGEGRPRIEADQDAIDISGSYVTIEGFEAHSTGWGSGIAVGKHNHHVAILDNVVRDSGCGGVSAQYTDYLTIERNVAFGNGRRAPWQCSGISIYHPEAFDRRPGVHNVIRENRSYDNQNQFVDEAISHSNGKTTDGNGIIVDDADHTQAPNAADPYRGETLIENNIVYDNGGRGIHVFHSANVVILHNLVWRDLKDPNLQRPAGEISAAFSRGVSVVDNIVVARDDEPPFIDGWDTGSNLFDFNLVSAKKPGLAIETPTRFGPHNVAGDALFAHPGEGADADFSVRAGSLAARVGVRASLGPSGELILSPGAPDIAGPRQRPVGHPPSRQPGGGG